MGPACAGQPWRWKANIVGQNIAAKRDAVSLHRTTELFMDRNRGILWR